MLYIQNTWFRST